MDFNGSYKDINDQLRNLKDLNNNIPLESARDDFERI